MMTLPIGLIGFFVVMFFSAGHVKVSDYLVLHSIVIVFAGSAAIAATCIPWGVLRSLAHNVLSMFRPRETVDQARADLMKLAESRSAAVKSKSQLIQYSMSLWEKGVDAATFQALISQYRDKLENEEAEALSSLHAISKYPPALGMLGTVMGMITLFANLGGSDKSGLGPALATAMTATFYGLIVTNGIISPLADRLTVEGIYRKKYNGAVYEILIMINRREPAKMIEDEIELRAAA